MHAIVGYRLASLFSSRSLPANAFAARTIVCPTPASVKLAMLSALLRRDGPGSGQEHVDWLAPLGVAWMPPRQLAVSAQTVRIWKSGAPNQRLDMSVGLREYVHAAEEFGLCLLDVPENRGDETEYALSRLRALGNAESLVQPVGPLRWAQDVPPSFVLLSEERAVVGEVATIVDDLGTQPSFERLSVFRTPDAAHVPRLGEDRRRLLIRLPLRVTRRTVDGYVLEHAT